MTKVKGGGFLEIGGNRIPFENKVNANFTSAMTHYIDTQRLSGQLSSSGAREVLASSFDLLSEEADLSMKRLYTRVGVAQSPFVLVRATPRMTTVRGTGMILNGGVVRSGGFNVICNTPPTGDFPSANIPLRRVGLSVTGRFTSVPFLGTWVFVPAANAFYRYSWDSTDVWKIPYDRTTGVWGIPVRVATTLPLVGNKGEITDRKHRLCRQSQSGTTISSIHVFDFLTDTVRVQPLNQSIIVSSGDTVMAWDSFRELWAINTVAASNTLVNINNGTVSSLSAPTGRTVQFIYPFFEIGSSSIRLPYTTTTLGETRWGTGAASLITDLGRSSVFPDDNGWILTGTFNALTSPSTFTMNFVREPDTSLTIFNIPPTPVTAGTAFTFEYTFEVSEV